MSILFGIAHYRKGFEVESSHILLTATGIFLYILPMLALNFVAQKTTLPIKVHLQYFYMLFLPQYYQIL